MEPIPFHFIYIQSQNNMSHTMKLHLDNFCNPRIIFLKEAWNKRDDSWQLTKDVFFTVQQTSLGLSHISKVLTLKFKMQILGFVQHKGSSISGRAKCSSIVFLQQVASFKLSAQRAPNWSAKLCHNHNAKFDAADRGSTFKGFFLRWDIHSRLEAPFTTWRN